MKPLMQGGMLSCSGVTKKRIYEKGAANEQ